MWDDLSKIDLTALGEGLGRLAHGSEQFDQIGFGPGVDFTHIESQLSDLTEPQKNTLLYLMRGLASEEQANLSYYIMDYKLGLTQPEEARQKFTIEVCRRRGWIDSERVAELQAMDTGVAKQELEKIMVDNARLRNGSVLRLRLNPGESAQEVLEREFGDNRFELKELLVRYLTRDDPQYLNAAYTTGNDRTSSNVNSYWTNGQTDGEELAMIKAGITNATDTTYVSRGYGLQHLKKVPILIYSPDLMEAIGPTGYPRSNGFHCFLGDNDLKHRSLLAVIE